ncbi:hypothetical protein JOD54_004534 [Actinokineospora baliensis]|uniref:TIR domain-containing protein n=1 Tax=Actinokineospora baliensis TaxID=547056 RepID=UPI00195B638F|nr:TIR domain-containing protein [Actinokineospora baliensis]MBM7774330.1 hypothetical protein [Actinokineospora baliensis]
MAVSREYDVSLTFAGSERSYAEELTTLLEKHGLRVFYDANQTVDLWGDNLYERLVTIYREKSRLCVLFASAEYARRLWTSFERKAAQAKAAESEAAYLLPLLFDDSRVPRLPSTTGAVDARLLSPAQVAEMVIKKLNDKTVAIGVLSTVLAVVAQEPDPGLHQVFNTALERSKITLTQHQRWSTHHGLVAVIPEKVAPVPVVLTNLVPDIESVHRERAASAGPLKVGVHSGKIPKGRSGVDIALAVDAARSAGVEELLTASKSRCAVVVSDRVFQTVVTKGRGGSNPTAYRRLRLPDGSQVHVRFHGYPRPPGDEPETPETPKASAGKSFYFERDVRIGQLGDVYLGNGNTFGDGYRFGSADDR